MMNMNVNCDLPFISAILVTKDEQDYVEKSLMSLVNQTYPKSRYEIIIVDGESADKTLEIEKQIKQKYETNEFSIRLYNNPKKILASGWNIGIREARGTYVVRIDAHAKASPEFLLESMKTMLRIDASCVGGRLETKTLSGNNDTISKILSSPFGVGNSSFRVSNSEGYVDTAVYGLYKKEIFEEIGYFSEKYVRNQDLQMHSRIKRSGGNFYFNPNIRCEYYTRNTTKKMIKQAFQNGLWNMVLLKEDRTALSLRHLVPFIFVLFLLFTIISVFFFRYISLMCLSVLVLYFVLGFVFGIKSGAKRIEALKMSILFFLLHVSYGTGYFWGLFR